MKPFQPNPQQFEAIANGATKLFIPIDTAVHSLDVKPGVFQSAMPFTCDWCNGTGMDGTVACIDCYGTDKQFDIDCESQSEFIKKYSPLQPEESYFVQEEFIEDPSQVIYKADFSKSNQDLEDWQPADQMTEAQSQYKFTVTGVEVKQVQELNDELFDLVPNNGNTFMEEYFPDQPYSSNLAGFLITIERIEYVKEN